MSYLEVFWLGFVFGLSWLTGISSVIAIKLLEDILSEKNSRIILVIEDLCLLVAASGLIYYLYERFKMRTGLRLIWNDLNGALGVGILVGMALSFGFLWLAVKISERSNKGK
ncbi:hypothetical protein [Furfurilactobacillus entadae]|uniref:hypothetical protein n=1 Tax=Furfurilactobacillus entadae TaxID=2922307 RepID=UPI0035E9D975